MELNDLLSTMTSEGVVDSSGRFTLDLNYAERKLDDYRLADPALFILNLVAAAVLSGADQFVVETERTETRVFFNGQWPEPERLPELFSLILKPSQYPAQRELALALHGARSLPNEPRISLQVGTRAGSWQALVKGARLETQAVPGQRIGVQVLVQHTASTPWARFLGQSQLNSGQKILEQLFHFCRYAPLDLKVNGQPKGSSVPMGLHAVEGPFARLFAQGPQKLVISRPGSQRNDVYMAPARPSPVASSMLVGLAGPAVARREGLLLICRGVNFRRSNELLVNPLACAVVTADHLEKNLSQTDLVENEDYHQLIQQVRGLVDGLLEEVCARPPNLQPGQSQALRALLQQRYPSQPRPVFVETFFRLQELGQCCATPQGAQEQTDYFLSLGPEQKKLAAGFREQLQSVLKARVLECMDFKRWGEACGFLDQAQRLGLPARSDFRMVLAFFANAPALARSLDQAESEDQNTTRCLLRYLWGWSSNLPNQSPLCRFFEFERALQNGQDGQASERLRQLEQATATPFLLLWLGWYAWFRHDYRRAEQLWFELLGKVSPALYRVWYPRMWKKLLGLLPLASQIRWQARHGIRSLSTPREQERIQSNEDPTLFDWSQQVWSLRVQGKNAEANQAYMELMLSYLLLPRKFALLPFSSPDLPTALPTS